MNRSDPADNPLRHLPPPDAAARAHSAHLCQQIDSAIDAAGGVLPFADYMALALYAPALGYYSAGSEKLGAGGDFITAPELTPLFGYTLAASSAELLAAAGGGDLLEAGAGSGALAVALLTALAARDALPRRYLILELSGELAARQRQRINAELAPELAARVVWLDQLPSEPVALVVANELLDALPAAPFRIGADGEPELRYIARATTSEAATHENAPTDPPPHYLDVWRAPPPAMQPILRALRDRYQLPIGYHSEWSPQLAGWLHALAAVVPHGSALLIDYGFPGHEYYHPQRYRGTLMCHYRHRAHDDALRWPGLQDITTHVDFTATAEAAVAADWQVAGFTNQANFLLDSGLLDRLAEQPADPQQQLLDAKAVQRLLMPGEMGELFKVMLLRRGIELPPIAGFRQRDQRARL